ncbi:MAG: alanine--glyoxylate aminotransferase family protein [Acidimicrobiales bacterium]|nr:alanine--glyoxylate aminotransferase family protein [Acidimicrobiales bacterium]
MPRSDRILMGPGPCNPYPEAIEAFGRPMLGHLDPEFLALLDDVCDRLRSLFGTTNALTVPISGTGSAGMETCIVNVLGPGDVAVIGVNGVFGQRMCDVASRTGAEVVRVDFEWGTPVTAERLLNAHPSPTLIGMVHAETSTGARSDVAEIGAGKGDALLLVDCVTSLGGLEFRADDWGVDLAYSGTQKCLGVPPGLSPITVSDRARDRFVAKSQSWYLDLRLIGDYVGTPGAKRAYHHTAPISMIFSLHGGLTAIADEGVDAVIERHATCGTAVQDGLVGLGFELFAQEGHRLPQLTTVRVPSGVDEAAIRSDLLGTYGIEIGGGLGEYAGKVWRVGCMGHTARERNVTTLVAALGELMAR